MYSQTENTSDVSSTTRPICLPKEFLRSQLWWEAAQQVVHTCQPCQTKLWWWRTKQQSFWEVLPSCRQQQVKSYQTSSSVELTCIAKNQGSVIISPKMSSTPFNWHAQSLQISTWGVITIKTLKINVNLKSLSSTPTNSTESSQSTPKRNLTCMPYFQDSSTPASSMNSKRNSVQLSLQALVIYTATQLV